MDVAFSLAGGRGYDLQPLPPIRHRAAILPRLHPVVDIRISVRVAVLYYVDFSIALGRKPGAVADYARLNRRTRHACHVGTTRRDRVRDDAVVGNRIAPGVVWPRRRKRVTVSQKTDKPYGQRGKVLDTMARERDVRGPYAIAKRVQEVSGHSVTGQAVPGTSTTVSGRDRPF